MCGDCIKPPALTCGQGIETHIAELGIETHIAELDCQQGEARAGDLTAAELGHFGGNVGIMAGADAQPQGSVVVAAPAGQVTCLPQAQRVCASKRQLGGSMHHGHLCHGTSLLRRKGVVLGRNSKEAVLVW